MLSLAFRRRTFYHEMARGVHIVSCTNNAIAHKEETISVLIYVKYGKTIIGPPRKRDPLPEQPRRSNLRLNPDI